MFSISFIFLWYSLLQYIIILGSSLCNNLSISYDLDKEIDIYLERTERLIPTEIIFTKRDNSIYLILMIPKSQNVQIQPGLLSDILS